MNRPRKMKRKLDANDVPAPAEEGDGQKAASTFADLELDPRLLQGIAKQNFKTPTLVQSKAIPLALNGRDVLARAKTGSGKTAAYLLPILNSILKRKHVCCSTFFVKTEANVCRLLQSNAHPPSSLYRLENLLNKFTKLSKPSHHSAPETFEQSTWHKRYPTLSRDLCSLIHPILLLQRQIELL